MAYLFPRFAASFGSPAQQVPVPAEVIEEYRGRLPDDILVLWAQDGWCAFEQGLLWLTNPREFSDVVPLFLPDHPDFLVFARSSFGDLLLWGNGRIYSLDAKYMRLFRNTDNVTIFFEVVLKSQEYKNDILWLDLHKAAVERLGELNNREVYAFVPALLFGGSETLESIQKVAIREHLAFLSQLTEVQAVG